MEAENSKIEIAVEEHEAGQRLDQIISLHWPFSRSQVKKFINQGKVYLNGEKARASSKTQVGDLITADALETPVEVSFTPQKIHLNILFEDENIIVLNKPPGLVVHPGAGTKAPTLVEGLYYHLKGNLANSEELALRPGVVHRLDKDTSGVIICAKDLDTHKALSVQFAEKTCYKEYIALVHGHIKDNQKTITSYLGRSHINRQQYKSIDVEAYNNLSEQKKSQFRFAHSEISVVERYTVGLWKASLVKILIKTGRTHQIRVHMKSLGHPVIRDSVYGTKEPKELGPPIGPILASAEHQLLHAKVLGITHPKSLEKVAFEADLPANFHDILKALQSDK